MDETSLLGHKDSRTNNEYMAQDDPVLNFGVWPSCLINVVVHLDNGSRVFQTDMTADQTIMIDGQHRQESASARPIHLQSESEIMGGNGCE